MAHNHCENHSHKFKRGSKSLILVLFITAFYMIAEFLGGYFTNSLALTADAGHMLGDVASLALSFFAIWLASQKASPEKTYGFYRAEIFAALINGVTLIFIGLAIIYEAYFRLKTAQEVNAPIMTAIALGGLLVNIAGAWILHKDSKENLNIKGAFFHIIGDLLGSIGAIAAGIMVYFWHFYIADTIISIIIAILVLYSSINITNAAVKILMEFAPKDIDIEGLKEMLAQISGVKGVHDLHVWNINSQTVSLSVHIVSEFQNNEQILCNINSMLREKFNILHATIQIEPEDFHEENCPLNL